MSKSKRNKNKKKADHQKLGLLDFGSVFLRTVKLLTDFFILLSSCLACWELV
jgi:hypothetical protein